jgi:hypothetical protein
MKENSLLRHLVFWVGGLETMAVIIPIGIVASSGELLSGEQLSRELAWVVLLIYGLPYLVFVAPALFLAFMDRYLSLAAALCILFPAIVFILYIRV